MTERHGKVHFPHLISSFFNVSVQGVVTDIELGIFHPFNKYWSLIDVKVILQEIFF